jgi:hypothetical protein
MHVPDPQMFSRRSLAEATRAYYYTVGMRWARMYLPKHFEKGNRERYGFAPRNTAYERRKRRLADAYPNVYKKEGQVDLVFLGRLERMAIASGKRNVRAFPNRVRIVMQTPEVSGWTEENAIDEKTGRRRPRFYVTSRIQKGYGPRMADEVKAVTFEELRDLKEQGLRAMNFMLNRSRGRYLYRRRSASMAA